MTHVKPSIFVLILSSMIFVINSSAQEITRSNEGPYFYRSITIPAGAETMYLSGSGAQPLDDGTWGDMRQQTIDTFSRFKETLEEQGWSMSDIVQVRAFAVAGEDGLDFAGFNAGYAEFFGTSDNPNKPVRSFVESLNSVCKSTSFVLEPDVQSVLRL